MISDWVGKEGNTEIQLHNSHRVSADLGTELCVCMCIYNISVKLLQWWAATEKVSPRSLWFQLHIPFLSGYNGPSGSSVENELVH